MIALATEEPAPVQSLNPEIPDALAQVIHALLAKAPAAHPQTAAEVEKRLRALERGEHPPDPRELTAAPAAAPQVVYVPIHVTAYEPLVSEFANLGDPSAVTEHAAAERTDEKPPAPPRPRARFPVWAVAVVAVLAVVVGGTVYALRKPTEIAKTNPPDQKADGKSNPPAPLPPQPPHPTRAFAQWVFDNGGTVDVSGVATNTLAGHPPGALNITGVSFVGSPFSPADADVPRFRECPNVKRIQMSGAALTSAGLKALLALPLAAELELLSFRGLKEPPDSLGQFAQCPRLRTLTFVYVPLTGRLKGADKVPALVNLTASQGDVTDADLIDLKGTRLTGLGLNACPKVTDAGLPHITALAGLTELNISDTGISRAGAAAVRGSPNSPFSTPTTWAGRTKTRSSSARTGLTVLHLNGNPVTDRTAEVLAAIPKLQVLSLSGTKVTDVGLARFRDNKALTQLDLRGAPVTLAGVKDLQRALPNCKVTFDYDPKADPDRLLAEWLISKGGSVRIAGKLEDFKQVHELPAGPLRVSCVPAARRVRAHRRRPRPVPRHVRDLVRTCRPAPDHGRGHEEMEPVPEQREGHLLRLSCPTSRRTGTHTWRSSGGSTFSPSRKIRSRTRG